MWQMFNYLRKGTTKAESDSATSTSIPGPTATKAHSGVNSLSRRNTFTGFHKAYQITRLCLEPFEFKVTAVVLGTALLGFGVFLAVGFVVILAHYIEGHGPSGDDALNGWGFRPDLGDNGGVEYKGAMDEVDRVLQRVGERRSRRVQGLPSGASLSGAGIEMYTLKRANFVVGEMDSDDEGETFPLLD